MIFDEEEEQPSRPIPKVTIVSAPGKPRRPDDWDIKHLQGEGGKPPDDETDEKDEKDKDQKRIEPCKVTGDDDDEELVDPQVRLAECCAKSEECSKLQDVLQACNDRVNSKAQTDETCTMELFDFIHCVNHCVTKDLFRYLK